MLDLVFVDTNIFTFAAYFGSGIVFIQFLINLLGWSDSEEITDSDGGEVKKLKHLSLQTIGGFLMMFGWSALACQKEFDLQIPSTVLLSSLVGLGSVFIINLIFKIAKKFQSSGNSCSLDDIIGKEALVYQRIPKDGIGKISISFPHITCEINAVSNSQEELQSFTRVQIIKKKDDNTVIVIPIIK